jgi:hypothetical protein
MHLSGCKKAGAEYPEDSSATRLSREDPIGFPSHFCKWFSIIVYLISFFVLALQRADFVPVPEVMVSIANMRGKSD